LASFIARAAAAAVARAAAAAVDAAAVATARQSGTQMHPQQLKIRDQGVIAPREARVLVLGAPWDASWPKAASPRVWRLCLGFMLR
jgi:hypothetical protein